MAATQTLTGASVKASLVVNATKATDLTTPVDPISYALTRVFANGTGDDAANQTWHDRATLSGAAVDDIDLAGGIVDAFGDTITFTVIKALFIANKSSELGTPTDSKISIGGHATNAFVNWVSDATDKVILEEDGILLLVAPKDGYAVAAGTNDILTITNLAGGAQAQYDILIIGQVA